MERPSFAQALRAARQEAGLSQAALGEKAGLTAPYISLIEAGRRRPPTPAVVERLARALKADTNRLLELAALERTPQPIRKRLEGLDREQGRVHRTRDKILSTTLFNLAQRPEVLADLAHSGEEALWFRGVLGRIGGKLRSVSSAREARARSAELLDPLPPAERDRLMDALPDVLGPAVAASPPPTAAPAAPTVRPAPGPSSVAPTTLALEVRDSLAPGAPARDTLHVDARWAGPRAFLWRLASDEAYPRLEAGDLLLVDPTRVPGDGDLVAFVHEAGESVRLLRRRGDEIRLDALRSDVAPLRRRAGEFVAVGVVTRVLRTCS